MHYMGGKQRVAKYIVPILNGAVEKSGSGLYIEPFVGGANIVTKVEASIRVASDIDEELIEMYRALQNGWNPPTKVSEKQYYFTRKYSKDKKLRAFVGYAMSWGGKKWGGYARDNTTRNYALNACNSLKKKNLNGIQFLYGSYQMYTGLTGATIYCDPPYKNTTGYTFPFDYHKFKTWLQEMAQNNVVFLSEHECDLPHVVLWEKEIRRDLRANDTKTRVDKLFRILPVLKI